MLHCRRDGRVGLEILYGLNFAVSRNETADGAALYGCRAHAKWSAVKGVVKNGSDHHDEPEPNPGPARRRTRVVRRCQPVFVPAELSQAAFFQAAAGLSASSNLPPLKKTGRRWRAQAAN